MWFDIYTCHLLLEKYPQLEKELEAYPLTKLTAELSKEDREKAQTEVDWLMMTEPQNFLGKIKSPSFFPFIYQRLAQMMGYWEINFHPRHYTPPSHPFLLKQEDYLLEDAEIRKVICKPSGEVSLFFVGAEDHTNGGEPMEEGRLYPVGIVDLELRLFGVPKAAYPSLEKLDYFVWNAPAVQREDGKLVMYLVTSGKHTAYFTFEAAEIIPAPYSGQ